MKLHVENANGARQVLVSVLVQKCEQNEQDNKFACLWTHWPGSCLNWTVSPDTLAGTQQTQTQ